jgi:8-oxo-dGTP pyrophosphatase MutT (NUDIX family)
MSVASRIAAPDVTVAKTYGTSVPPQITAAEERSQMTPASPFSPGEPIGPYDGFSRTPRSHEFVTSVNTSSRPRSHERVSFETLKGLIRSYDVAQLCIRHRIASLRSLDWKLIAADAHDGDVASAIETGMAALKRPDRKTLFKPWLAKYLRGILSFDAGTLYRMRNRGGRVVGLKVIDGTTIAPLIDYWGDSPEAEAPAYVQYVNGLPWNWLTRDDLIYEPYDPQDDSIYGRAPLEDILLNANTDIRFQLYFLQRFTEGNLPHAFASAPETWTPDQIEQFQEYWDGFMLGDQSRKHQIRWVPGGSSFAWSDEKEFTDNFSLFLMRKTCAAYSVVPSDLGFTESVNRSSGESQADVQHRVGDLPLAHHVMDILSAFLQDDLGLPLKFIFDLGEEQDDRVDQAQADDIYMKMGVIGPSDIREMRYGLAEPEGKPVPRFIYTERSGPIPLSSLFAVAGEIDPATAAPLPDAPLSREVFGGTEGVLPNPPIHVMSLAEQMYGESAMPPAPPPQPVMQPSDATGAPVAKEGEAAAAAGITAETGLYSYDLVRALDDDEDSDAASVAKEMRAFRNFEKARRKAGEWRDFEFRAIGRTRGHNLNDSGRLAVRKEAGQVAVAGLAVLAADTGRVLMLQRALVDDDPAAGTWEFPGGHLEGDESPLAAAWREWQEETGSACAPGVQTGSWTSGIYQGIVWTIEREAMVPVRSDSVITNPDDPDSDQVEAIAWWDPETLPGNPVVRPELLAAIDDVMTALGCTDAEPTQGDESTCPCGTPVVYDEMNGWQHADGSVSHDNGESVSDKMAGIAKAADARPKGWPGWKLDLRAASYWQPFVTASAQQSLTRDKLNEIGTAYIAANPGQDGTAPGKRDRNAAALAWLTARGVTVPMGEVAEGIATDAAMIGGASAQAAVNGDDTADTGDWEPGDPVTARQVAEGLGVAAVLALMPGGDGSGSGGGAAGTVAGDMEDGYLNVVARVLAGWDPDVAAEELTGMLSDAVADGAYAEGLTVTQITTVSGDAAMDYYLANSLSELQWLVDDSPNVCPVCLANERAGPIPARTAWPSGAQNVPQHPRCRCSIVPAWFLTGG